MRDWLPLIERLARGLEPRGVLWVTGLKSSDAEVEIVGLLRNVGATIRTVERLSAIDEDAVVDLVLFEGDPNWASTKHGLEAVGAWTEAVEGRIFPVVLLPHVGWPYGRRDGYGEPEELPEVEVNPYLRGGVIVGVEEPLPGRGFAPDRAHALLEHPFRNGRLSAVEDFLRGGRVDLRCRILPGFHDLAVLAPPARTREDPFLRELFENPGAVLYDCEHIERLERMRLEALYGASREAPDVDRSGLVVGSAGAGARESLEAPRERLVEAKERLAATEDELRALASRFMETRSLVLDLLDSHRWRLGNRLGDLYLKVRRLPKTETVEGRLRELMTEVSGLGLADMLTRGARAVPQVEVPGSDGPSKAEGLVGTDGARSRFHRLVSQIDTGSRGAEFQSIWRRSEAIIKTARERRTGRWPRVSVIMPTRDRAHILGEAVASVLEQRYTNWQLIVCDDGSRDETRQVIADLADPRIQYLRISASGAAAARNRALREANGELISYLDSDNVWHPDFLQVMVGELEEHPAYAAAYAGHLDVEMEDHRTVLKGCDPRAFDYEALSRSNFIDLNTVVHRRELYDVFGGFDASLTRFQDWDLLLRYGFVTDFLAIGALVTLYRRNRDWDQITTTELGNRPWKTVRSRVDEYYEEGVPREPQEAEARPLRFIVDAHHSAAIARAQALVAARAECGDIRDIRDSVTVIREDGSAEPVPLPRGGREGEGRAGNDDPRGDERMEDSAGGGSPLLYLVDPSDHCLDVALAGADPGQPILAEQSPGEPVARILDALEGHRKRGAFGKLVLRGLSPACADSACYNLCPLFSESEESAGKLGAATAPATARNAARAVSVLEVGPGLATGTSSETERSLEESGFAVREFPGEESGPDRRSSSLRSIAVLVIAGPRDARVLSEVARQAVTVALAERIPIVATRCREMSALEDAGCVQPSAGLPGEIVRTVQDLLDDPGRVLRLTERGFRYHQRRHSPRAVRYQLELLSARTSATRTPRSNELEGR